MEFGQVLLKPSLSMIKHMKKYRQKKSPAAYKFFRLGIISAIRQAVLSILYCLLQRRGGQQTKCNHFKQLKSLVFTRPRGYKTVFMLDSTEHAFFQQLIKMPTN